MRRILLLALLLGACAGPPPTITEMPSEPAGGAPSVTVGGGMRAYYGNVR